jgi:tRNA threonylcarbamoyladenosine biosynthesis protein TsaB
VITLAIETATSHASVALIEGSRELAAWREVTHQDLCQRLAHEARLVLEAAGRSFGDLELIAAGLGPGSFTSVRVGLATAKGFALARDLPLVGVPSLAAMAWQMRDRLSGLVCPIIDARRGELYAGLHRLGSDSVERVTEEWVTTAADLAARLDALDEPAAIIGDAAQLSANDLALLGNRVYAETAWPDAVAVADLAMKRFAAGGGDELGPLRPIYVRMSYAEESRRLDLGLR